MRSATLSTSEKSAVTAVCQELIEGFLKPRFLPAIRPTVFNYPVDILGKWHGNKYRFIQRYRSGFADNLGEELDSPFARLDWIGPDHFDVQWHRHTGDWYLLHRRLSLADAIATAPEHEDQARQPSTCLPPPIGRQPESPHKRSEIPDSLSSAPL